jgi:hypothetical protein
MSTKDQYVEKRQNLSNVRCKLLYVPCKLQKE